MSKPDQYLTELKELTRLHGATKIAELLGVTERGMANWVSEVPKVPHPKTQRKISELFRKLSYDSPVSDFKPHSGVDPEVSSDFTRLTMQALADLTRSNLNISESNKAIAAAHRELVEMTKGSMSSTERSTLNQTALLVHALYDQFVEFVSEVKGRPVGEIRKKFDNKLRALKDGVHKMDSVP